MRYAPHASETICTFTNSAIGSRARLRISRRLMLSVGSILHVKEALVG